MSKNVLQDWVRELSYMQQSVLISAVRAPDGIRKDHPVKVLMRWYRRCTLICSFTGEAFTDAFSAGGGSFTGPFTYSHVSAMGMSQEMGLQTALDKTREIYLRHVDELPHHFQLHFMHAAQIIGYKHSDQRTRYWWLHFYHMIVNDAHLWPETEEQMDLRLSDNEEAWRAREVVTAK